MTGAAIGEHVLGFGPVADHETDLLDLPSLTAALIGLLRGRGAQVRWVDTSGWADCDAATMLLVSSPHETTTGSTERAWRWWAIDREEEPLWRAGLDKERRELIDDALIYIDAPNTHPAPLVDYLTGAVWTEGSEGSDALATGTQMMALAQWWDARIAEGHTSGPEGSAALMLALILPPRALGRLRFNATGAPSLTP